MAFLHPTPVPCLVVLGSSLQAMPAPAITPEAPTGIGVRAVRGSETSASQQPDPARSLQHAGIEAQWYSDGN